MREHRMKKNFYSIKYNNQTYDFIYKRNYYGFRGDEINLEDIKAVFIGGSTADERYKPEKFTITGYLNQKLKEEKIELKIINAGIEGQSTLGHIYNFEVWFPRLKKFKPDYVIFYVGINDHILNENFDKTKDGHVLNPSKKEKFKDNFKSKSIFYDLLRKTKHKYSNSGKKVMYDFDAHIQNIKKKKNYKFLNFENAKKTYDIESLKNKNKFLIKNYLNNIDKLANLVKIINAKPIFINQLTEEGNYNKELFILNYSLISHCKKKQYDCIDIAKSLEGKKEYWWDGIHTTPEGSKKISELIFPDFLKLIKN